MKFFFCILALLGLTDAITVTGSNTPHIYNNGDVKPKLVLTVQKLEGDNDLQNVHQYSHQPPHLNGQTGHMYTKVYGRYLVKVFGGSEEHKYAKVTPLHSTPSSQTKNYLPQESMVIPQYAPVGPVPFYRTEPSPRFSTYTNLPTQFVRRRRTVAPHRSQRNQNRTLKVTKRFKRGGHHHHLGDGTYEDILNLEQPFGILYRRASNIANSI